jgi:hypothetical protein
MTIAETSTEATKGEQLHIVVCPLCGAKRGEDYEDYSWHLATHSWCDLGL